VCFFQASGCDFVSPFSALQGTALLEIAKISKCCKLRGLSQVSTGGLGEERGHRLSAEYEPWSTGFPSPFPHTKLFFLLIAVTFYLSKTPPPILPNTPPSTSICSTALPSLSSWAVVYWSKTWAELCGLMLRQEQHNTDTQHKSLQHLEISQLGGACRVFRWFWVPTSATASKPSPTSLGRWRRCFPRKRVRWASWGTYPGGDYDCIPLPQITLISSLQRLGHQNSISAKAPPAPAS